MKTGLFWVFIMFTFLMIGCTIGKNAFDLKKNNSSNPVKVIAHRGGAKLAPENTLAAIKNALDLQVDMIEIDVILSKDKEVIVIHDARIDRTTNGSGDVKEMTLSEIKKYDAGRWFDEKFKGETIPTLDEVFKTINKRATLLIEIKNGDEKYPGLESKVLEDIQKYQAHDWVIVQSFNEQTVLRFKKMDPAVRTYYLLGSNFVAFYANIDDHQKPLPYDGIAVRHSSIRDTRMVETIKNRGYDLFVWTVNEEADMRRLLEIGVKGIITDRPDLLLSLTN